LLPSLTNEFVTMASLKLAGASHVRGIGAGVPDRSLPGRDIRCETLAKYTRLGIDRVQTLCGSNEQRALCNE